MESEVDPSADALWAAVSFTADARGGIENQPRTDEEWSELRRFALILVESTNLLAMPGREVTTRGRALTDATAPGNLSPQQIHARIRKSQATFAAFARALQDVSVDALGAIDARNAARLQEVGGRIDEVCEACHLTFWYPPQSTTVN